MIRNIVFDMGQVLLYWDPDRMTGRLGLPEEDAARLAEAVFRCPEWTWLDEGTVSRDEALAVMRLRLPERLHPYAEELVRGWWKAPLFPVPGMQALIGELKDLGYRIYLLSNASSDLHQYFHRIPGSQYFDGKIVSADWKLLKPRRELYEVLFREYGLRPEECFFIDDLSFNIDGARNAGMDGTVFDGDPVHLRRALRDAGIPVS